MFMYYVCLAQELEMQRLAATNLAGEVAYTTIYSIMTWHDVLSRCRLRLCLASTRSSFTSWGRQVYHNISYDTILCCATLCYVISHYIKLCRYIYHIMLYSIPCSITLRGAGSPAKDRAMREAQQCLEVVFTIYYYLLCIYSICTCLCVFYCISHILYCITLSNYVLYHIVYMKCMILY